MGKFYVLLLVIPLCVFTSSQVFSTAPLSGNGISKVVIKENLDKTLQINLGMSDGIQKAMVLFLFADEIVSEQVIELKVAKIKAVEVWKHKSKWKILEITEGYNPSQCRLELPKVIVRPQRTGVMESSVSNKRVFDKKLQGNKTKQIIPTKMSKKELLELVDLARKLFKMGRISEAKAMFEKILKEVPNDPQSVMFVKLIEKKEKEKEISALDSQIEGKDKRLLDFYVENARKELVERNWEMAWRYLDLASRAGLQKDKYCELLQQFYNNARVTDENGIQFQYVGGGSFKMGSSNHERDERPCVTITIDEGFWVETTEVLKGTWEKIMGTAPWRGKEDALDLANTPATHMTWYEARQFVQRLNRQSKLFRYSLPSEAEWEYICRVTRKCESCRSFHISKNSLCTNKTKVFSPKSLHEPSGGDEVWGIVDLLGNVAEYCLDYYHDNYINLPLDGSPVKYGGSFIVVRGGSFHSKPESLRPGKRYYANFLQRRNDIGFRVIARRKKKIGQ